MMPLSMSDAHIQQNHVPTHFPKADVNACYAHEDKLYIDLNTTDALVKKSRCNIIYDCLLYKQGALH